MGDENHHREEPQGDLSRRRRKTALRCNFPKRMKNQEAIPIGWLRRKNGMLFAE
jgi:hypothetical protein